MRYEKMEENIISRDFLIWLAGLIDGDGCFCISLALRTKKTGTNWIQVVCQVRVALKESDGWLLHEIHKLISLGKIYYSNKGREYGICSWQTTNWDDAIMVTELILPYLRLKKKKAEQFLEMCRLYRDNMLRRGSGDRHSGPIKDKNTMLELAKISTTLNYDHPKKRYHNYKNYDYWEKIINELYK